jgi:hypothetical protein
MPSRQGEASARGSQVHLLPLVDRQTRRPRIRNLSRGLNLEEAVIKPPLLLDWDRCLPQVAELGLQLPGSTTK